MGCNGMAFFPTNFMLQTSHDEDDHIDHHNPNSLSPILPPCSTHQDFHGVASFLGKRSLPFSSTMINNNNDINVCDQETNNGHGEDELSDDGSQLLAGEMKKRRLNNEQVKTLERSFELGNKLEPERKMELARALGLHPRQIAIWFQNRRARWKTKQLEKDYDALKAQFDAVKAQNDSLQSQNHKLQAEIKALKNRDPTQPNINLNIKETEGSCSNKSENSSEMKLNISRTQAAMDSPSNHHNHHHHHHHQIPNLFPCTNNANNIVAHQLFENSSSRLADCQKMDQTTAIKEESFCNMFVGIEDQSGFWPWLEQPQFN